MQALIAALSAATVFFGTYANAAVLLDYSPATTNVSTFGAFNQSNGQHFYQQVTFAQDATITGMAVYANASNVFQGEPAYIDIYSNNGNDLPGFSVNHFTTPISGFDTQGVGSQSGIVRAYTDFSTPVTMTAGEKLWFSMSGFELNLSIRKFNSLSSPSASPAYQFNVFNQPAGLSDANVAIQIYGTLVPEPASLTLAGAMAIGLLRRPKRSSKTSL